MVNLRFVTEIELDTENPFKHEIVYYIEEKEAIRKKVPAFQSKELFAEELKRWYKKDK